MTTTTKVAANTIYQIVGKTVSMAVTVLATMIITRAYGKSGYGEFSLMQGWPALLFIIVDFGINAIATRELSKDFSKAGEYIGNILLIRVLFSLFFMALLFTALAFFPYSYGLKLGIRLGLLLILTQSLFTTTNIIFQVKLRYDLSAIGYTVGYFVILVLVLVLSSFNISVMWVNFSYVIGGSLTFIMNLIFIRRLGVTPSFVFNKKIWSYLLVNSLPLGLMFVFSQINFKSDSLMLSVMNLPNKYELSNTETVGVYSLPYKIFEVALVVPTFFMNSLYPIMIKHLQRSPEKLKDTFYKAIRILAILGVVCGLIGVLFSEYAIIILGGSAFLQSIWVLRVLMGGLILYYLTQPLSWLLVTLEKQVYLPIIYLIGACIDVGGNLIFIPKYSLYASTIITHISEFVILILLVYFSVRSWKEKYA